jgi:Cu+-exporting ATPase
LASIITIPGFAIMFLDMLKIVQIPYMDIINLVLAFPIIFIAGSEVIKRAFKGVVHGVFGMDLLIAAGATISYLSSILRLFSLDIYGFAFVGGIIMFFHLLGKYLEALAKGRASSAIQSLLVLGAKTARIIVDNMEVDVPVQELDAGDVMVVRPGEKIPTDGIVAEGETTVDESMVTGESMAVTKAKGAEVIGGTINQTGFIKVNAKKVGEDTFLSQLIALVESAQNSRVPLHPVIAEIAMAFSSINVVSNSLRLNRIKL